MNIHIIENTDVINIKSLANGCIVQMREHDSKFEGIKIQQLFVHNPENGVNMEIEPDIIKYNFIKINDTKLNSNYIYFTGITSKEQSGRFFTIKVYRHDIENAKTSVIYEFEEDIEKYSKYMRTKIFAINNHYLFIQNEYLRSNLTEEYDGYFDFEQWLFSVNDQKKYKIYDEYISSSGIMSLMPVSEKVCLIKTGYSLFKDNRYKILKKHEAVRESIGFLNIAQMVSDIIEEKKHIVMDTIESVFYSSTIPYVKVHGEYICYSKIKLGEKLEEEVVFYNYSSKKSLMCINNDVNRNMQLASVCILKKQPHIIIKKPGCHEFVNVSDPKKKIVLDDKYKIECIEEKYIIASIVKRKWFIKKQSQIFVFEYPSMQILHRESGRFRCCTLTTHGTICITKY